MYFFKLIIKYVSLIAATEYFSYNRIDTHKFLTHFCIDSDLQATWCDYKPVYMKIASYIMQSIFLTHDSS